MRNNKVIFVTGVSGTGKSAVCRALKKKGVSAVDLDETPGLCHWVNKETGEKCTRKSDFSRSFIARHWWTIDLLCLQELIKTSTKPLVMCGSADNFLEVMKLCDTTLLLKCEPTIFLARIDARIDNEYGKSDDVKQALLGYYQSYNKQCLEAGAFPLDAGRVLELVVAEVISYLVYDES